jgi:hypothetical protein
LVEKDLGSGWKPYQPPKGLENNNVRSCSTTIIKLPGNPQSLVGWFGGPDNLTDGANYTRYVAVYSDEKSASKAFDTIHRITEKCPDKRTIPFKKLPQNRVVGSHDDTWALTEDPVSDWTHLRGTEKAVYSPSATKLNIYHLIFDYALRGNVVFTSAYWQRLEPKKSSSSIEKKATELLTKQLAKIG